jgi:hypothetical protein
VWKSGEPEVFAERETEFKRGFDEDPRIKTAVI